MRDLIESKVAILEKKKKRVKRIFEEACLLDSLLDIDVLRLEEQSAEQPKAIKDIYDLFAEAEYLVSNSRDLAEEVEGLIARWVLKDPEAFSLEKTTEKMIVYTIHSDKSVLQAKDCQHEIKKWWRKVEGRYKAFENRRSMLKNETELFGREYFHKDDFVAREKREETKEEVDVIRERIKKKKKKKGDK